MRLLDLFCCQGGAAAGYARAGFDVVGVDLEPQPRYPFTFVQADALDFLAEHGHEFDAIHASPPCQDHSRSRHASGGVHGTGWLLDETLRMLGQQTWRPWIVENVSGAVLPSGVTLCGTTFGLGLHRHRVFQTSWEMMNPGCDPSRVRYRGRAAEVFGHHGNLDRVQREWDVPWMSQYGAAQCIPPVFTEYLGNAMTEAYSWA